MGDGAERHAGGAGPQQEPLKPPPTLDELRSSLAAAAAGLSARVDAAPGGLPLPSVSQPPVRPGTATGSTLCLGPHGCQQCALRLCTVHAHELPVASSTAAQQCVFGQGVLRWSEGR
jgi:hypothetical protein